MSTPAAAAWAGHPKGSPAYRRVLAGLFFAGVATFAQLYSPQAVLPAIARDLSVAPAESALVVSASTIGLAAGVIPWSVVADRIGRVRTMTIAVSAATAFGLLVPFSPTFGVLLAGRLLEGLALGGVPAIAIAYLSEEVAARHAARAAGTYVAGTTIGGLLGRIVAGPVSELSDWRIGVFTVAVICAASAVAFVALLPPAQGFVALRDRPEEEAGSLGHRLAANLRNPRLLALYAQAFLLMGGFVAVYNFLGFRLAAPPFELAPALVSLIFVAYLAGTFSSARAGGLAARFGRPPVLLGGAAVMLVGVLLTLSGVLAVVLAGLVVATAGFFAAHSVASGGTGAEATVGRAQASSLYNLFYYAGSSLFGWLGGVFFGAAGWMGTASMVAVLVLLAASAALTLVRRAPVGADVAPRR